MPSIITASTASNTALNFSADTSGVLEIRTGSSPTTAMTIDGSQNVGIGTSSPTALLHVNGTTNISSSHWLTFGGANTLFSSASLGLLIQTPSGNENTIFRNSSGTERMRIDSSGNVLVGRTSVTGTNCRLNVQLAGTSASGYTAASNAGISLDAGTVTNGVINLVGGAELGVYRSNSSGAFDVGIGFGDNSNRILRFDTAGAERMRINSSGNVGIGNASPSFPLDVGGAGQFSGYARITAVGGAQRLLMGNQDSIGTNKPAIIVGANSTLSFGYGNTWSGDGGTFTGLFQINSTGTSNDFTSVLAGGTTLYPAYFPRAFIAVNQQGTQSNLASGNVSSIADQGTGLTLVNLSTAMPNTNYIVANGISGSGVISGVCLEANINSASSFQLRALSTASPTAYDMPYVTAIVIR